MNQKPSNLLSSLTICLIAGIGLSLSCKASVEEKPERELITRRSEPFVPRIKRASANRFEISDELWDRVESTFASEFDANTVKEMVGLQYGPDRVVLVAHTRFPTADLEEPAIAAATDEEALARCDETYSSCAQGFDDCDDTAYETCVRSAYSDLHVYAAMHLGMNCAILMVSRFAVTDDEVRLMEQTVLEEFACELQWTGHEAAAQDVDLDDGPEVAFAYSFIADTALSQQGRFDNILTIVDAADLHVQARLVVADAPHESGERQLMNALVEDRNGDGLPDLVIQQISTIGEYCPEAGWATSPPLLRATPDNEYDTCEMRVTERAIPYDPTRDVWEAAAQGDE